MITPEARPAAVTHTASLPQENTAMETNWPRYRDEASGQTRGLIRDISASGLFTELEKCIA